MPAYDVVGIEFEIIIHTHTFLKVRILPLWSPTHVSGTICQKNHIILKFKTLKGIREGDKI